MGWEPLDNAVDHHAVDHNVVDHNAVDHNAGSFSHDAVVYGYELAQAPYDLIMDRATHTMRVIQADEVGGGCVCEVYVGLEVYVRCMWVWRCM